MHTTSCALALALANDGSRIPMSTAMIPTTTNSSTNVNPQVRPERG